MIFCIDISANGLTITDICILVGIISGGLFGVSVNRRLGKPNGNGNTAQALSGLHKKVDELQASNAKAHLTALNLVRELEDKVTVDINRIDVRLERLEGSQATIAAIVGGNKRESDPYK